MTWFSTLRVASKLALAFTAVVCLTVGLGVFAIVQLARVNATSDEMEENWLPSVNATSDMNTNTSDFRAAELEHILGTTTAEMDTAEAELRRHAELLQKNRSIYQPLAATPDEKRLLGDFDRAWAAYLREHERIVAASRQGRAEEARGLARGDARRHFEEASRILVELATLNEEGGKQASQRGSALYASSRLWVIGILLGIVAVATVLATAIVRNVNNALSRVSNELREGAEQVTAAATQVSTAAQALSQGASEQAASLEETSASMEEMSSMTRKNAENAHEAAGLMRTVDGNVLESNKALSAMVTSMSSIRESSGRVSKIIKTIDEIAFQTNILALNAAVEAARAGDAGMGFAVVADEVRALAQRSAQAARDTSALIEESVTSSETGSRTLELVATSIGAIGDSVTRLKGLVEEVNVASRQQSQGIDQVAQAVSQMEKVTQTTAATAEESAAASEELNAQAETSLALVGQLEAMVHGQDGAGRARPATKRPGAAKVTHPRTSATVHPIRPAARPVNPTPEQVIPLESTGTFGQF